MTYCYDCCFSFQCQPLLVFEVHLHYYYAGVLHNQLLIKSRFSYLSLVTAFYEVVKLIFLI